MKKKENVVFEWNKLQEQCSFIVKPFLLLSVVYFIGISAIIRANFNYIDDMGRVAKGYKQWDVCSRYISYYLSSFVHGDSYLTDVSPLPQILAVAILVLSSIVVLYLVSGKKEFSFWQLAGIIPLGLSPYFLECISYKYDSPYMALSILVALVPALFRKKKNIIYGIASLLGMIAVCTTYQPATGIFPMLVILLAVKDWNEGKEMKEIINFVMVSVIGYGVGLVIFRLFIMQSVDSYVSNATPGIKELIPMAMANLGTYFKHIITDFKVEWLVFAVIMGIAYVWVVVRESRRNKIAALAVVVVSLALMLCLAFGIYPVLADPLYAPRAMYGVGVFLAFLAATITSAQKVYPGKIVCVLLSWAFFVFSFTYGNALAVQSTYTDYRISMVMDDLNDMEIFTTEETKTVQISGTIGYAQVINNMPQDYDMLNRLVPITFRGEWYWGAEGFFSYYGIKNSVRDTSIDLTTYDLPIVKDTMYHTIKATDNYVLIELK